MLPKSGKKKPSRKKITKLQKFARGQNCTLRLPSCNHDPETVVLCHVKPRGFGSMGAKLGSMGTELDSFGAKPSDYSAVHACSSCHDWLDGRAGRATRDQIESAFLPALIETVDRAAKAGLLDKQQAIQDLANSWPEYFGELLEVNQ